VNLRRAIPGLLAILLMLSLAVWPAAAEELILKNGQKIVGTIVGYENDMFRVETEFGIALVRKDKVSSIQISPSGAGDVKPSTAKTSKSGAGKAEKAAETAAGPAASADTTKSGNPVAQQEPARETSAVVPTAPPPKPPPPPVSRPVDEPLPAHIQEHVEGNTYVNDTFQFAMFKPPGWKIYEGVPRETGSGVMAVGTEDEQTLLIVDRQVWSGTPQLQDDRVEARLRRTYQDYAKLSEETMQVGGRPAVRSAFKGVLEGTEWHGIAVRVARGNIVFGIIGLTSAETYEFEQAVLNKIINSFHFLTPASPTAPGPPAGTMP
jgi:molybdopterin-binding protein